MVKISVNQFSVDTYHIHERCTSYINDKRNRTPNFCLDVQQNFVIKVFHLFVGLNIETRVLLSM